MGLLGILTPQVPQLLPLLDFGSLLARYWWVFPSLSHRTAVIHLAGGFSCEERYQSLVPVTHWLCRGVTCGHSKTSNIIMLLLTSELSNPSAISSSSEKQFCTQTAAVTVLRILSAWTLILSSVGLGKTREKINYYSSSRLARLVHILCVQ